MKRPMKLPSRHYPYPNPITKFLTLILKFHFNLYPVFLTIPMGCRSFNKLHAVKPTLGEWYPSYRSIRREEVIIIRLRIGHSHLTHSWLLAKEDAPECIQCNEYLTMKHIFLDCIEFQPIRDKHYSADNMYNLFDTVRIDSIIAFIRDWSIQ